MQSFVTGREVERTMIAKTKVQIGSTTTIPGYVPCKKYIIVAAKTTPAL